MEDAPRARGPVNGYEDPAVLRYTTDYFVRLLVQRHTIRAALTNYAGSVVLYGVTKLQDEIYSPQLPTGSDLHLDLMEAEAIVRRLPGDQRRALLQWVDGMSFPDQAYFERISPDAIRMRKNRALESAATKWKAREIEERNA